MASIIATGSFHTLLLTVDAHGRDPTPSFSINRSVEATPMILVCREDDKAVLSWNAGANNSCQYGDLLSITWRLNVPACTYQCEDPMQFCMVNTTNCKTYEESVDFKVTLNEEAIFDLSGEECSAVIPEFYLHNSSEAPLRLKCSCSLRCPLIPLYPTSNQIEKQRNATLQDYDEAKHTRGFYLYLVIRILATAALGTSFTMLDATTICLIKKYQGELGKQRLFGVIGAAVFAMCSGLLLDWTSGLNNGMLCAVTRSYNLFINCFGMP